MFDATANSLSPDFENTTKIKYACVELEVAQTPRTLV